MAKALTPRVGLASMARVVTAAVLAWVSSTRVGQTRVASMLSGVEPLGPPRIRHDRGESSLYIHKQKLQHVSSPEKPDAVYARKLQEVIGGQYG